MLCDPASPQLQTVESHQRWVSRIHFPPPVTAVGLIGGLTWWRVTATAARRDVQPSWDGPDNTLLFQSFEWHVPADQGHWTRLRRALPELQSIGVSQIWLPPGCKGMDPSGNGYDIYDLYDLGQFDQKGSRSTKWGSQEELEALVLQAQRLNIQVYWDAVLNHKAGADYTEQFLATEVDTRRMMTPPACCRWRSRWRV